MVVGAPAFGTEVPVDVNHLIGGRTVSGLTLGDSETQSLIPVLAGLVASGRLVRHYRFEDIQEAVADVASGATIKAVLSF